jgi:CheY-like chemotaxis protein
MLLGRTEQGFIYVFDEPVRILAVDDDPIMREMAVAQLSHPGGDVVTARDGREAWDILDADPGFDLVISDLEMPVMTGFALCAAIREDPRFARLPVVVLTGREDMFAIDRAYEVGATSFATKPVNWRMLGYQLRYVLRTLRDTEPASAPSLSPTLSPDPETCLRIVLAQPPEQIARIVAEVVDEPAARTALRRYAELAGADVETTHHNPGSTPCDAAVSTEATPPATTPTVYDPPAASREAPACSIRDDGEAARAGVANPVAAMRAQLRETRAVPQAAPASPARAFGFFKAGGRS